MTVKIAKLSETEAVSLPKNSWSRKLLTRGTVGSGKCMLGVSRFTPGTVTVPLIHQEEELAYVLKGQGKICLKDGDVTVGAGDGIYIPAGTSHSVVNDGDQDLDMVFVFSWPDYPPTEKG